MTLSGSSSTFPPAGGAGTVTVTTDRDCTWAATAGAAWISVSGSTGGQGNGTVAFSVAPNDKVTGRSSDVAVNGQGFTISEQPAPCSFTVSPGTVSMAASGGTATVTVQAQGGCAWTAAGNVPWISIASGSAGNGQGTVQLAIALNAGDVRTGTAVVAGQTITISQDAAPAPSPPPPSPPPPSPPPPPAPPPPPGCSYSISPASQSFDASGGNGSVSVATSSGCSWTATGGASWVTITSGSSGTGNGTVSFSADANTDVARSTTLNIAGQTFTITEAAFTCSFAISAASSPNHTISVPATGGTVTVTVTTASSCGWTAQVSDSWMTIASGAAGTGPGAVVVIVSPNPGGNRRNGFIAVQGQQLTVHQDGA